MPFHPLHDTLITTLATNLPGPTAARRLVELGARVIKVEPPGGDMLARFSPDWYQSLNAGQEVLRLDLKSAEGRRRLDEILREADLLLTATRPASLERLGLGWEALQARCPRLCQVAIVGYPQPDVERPGHDLSYQAGLGLVRPPHMPHIMVADLAGAEWAVSACLALLLDRQRRGPQAYGGYQEVSLYEAARAFARPLPFGALEAEGPLGGGFAGYHLYQAQDGWVAVAALEPQFWTRLNQELGLDPSANDPPALQRLFAEHPAEYWESWALERDLPLAAVRGVDGEIVK